MKKFSINTTRNAGSWLTIVAAAGLVQVGCGEEEVAENPCPDTTKTFALKPENPGTGKPDGVGGGKPSTDEGSGNNLSVPLIFADGYGLAGAKVTDADGNKVYANTGLRPAAAEGLTVTSLPFSHLVAAGEYPYADYYLQQTENAWQAMWADASQTTPPAAAQATVDWGDNLVNQTWTTSSVIRVETVLFNLLGADGTPQKPLMPGFDMTYLYGEGATEMWGTSGTTSDQNATIFSICARLTISKCQGDYNEETDTCSTPWVEAINSAVYEGIGTDGPGSYGAEVNVSGRAIYGYNWMMKTMPTAIDGQIIDKQGWWRLQFKIDPNATVGGAPVQCNVELTNLNPADTGGVVTAAAESEGPLYMPVLADASTSYLDIYVTERRTGKGSQGGGGGGGTNGGGGGQGGKGGN